MYSSSTSVFKNVSYYIPFFSLIINLDYATLTLSTSKISFPKYNHTVSQTRHNNLLLKLRLFYLCNTTSDLSSSLVFQSNLSFILLMENFSECESFLTIMRKSQLLCKILTNCQAWFILGGKNLWSWLGNIKVYKLYRKSQMMQTYRMTLASAYVLHCLFAAQSQLQRNI